MATTLYQMHGGAMEREDFEMLFDTSFQEVVLRQERVLKQGTRFVRQDTTTLVSSKRGEVSSVLDLPNINEDSEDIPLVNPVQGHEKTFTTVQHRSGIIATREAVETQVFKEIVRMMRGLPASADRLVEYSIADLFNNGFATQTGADGSYLFAADHTYEDAQAGSWTNTGTAASFSTASYFLAWQNLQARKNEKGFIDPMDSVEVVYPYTIHDKVREVLGSEQVAENALNMINPFKGDATPQKYNYLTSSTAWFLHGKRPGDTQEDEGFLLLWRVRPNYETISKSDNPDLLYGKRLRMAFTVGAFHARNWYGNQGA